MITDNAATPSVGAGSTGADTRRAAEVAFEVFYRANWRSLYRSVMRMGATPDQASDVVQTTMSTLYRSWDQVEYPQAWCRAVATRELIKLRMADTQRRLRDGRLAMAIASDRPVADHIAAQDEALFAQSGLWHAVRALPPRQRLVLGLMMDGYTSSEIGALLGMSEATVRSTRRHARERIQALLPNDAVKAS